MLRSLDDLKQYAIHATDGDIGRVSDFYFDDVGWAIRYLVVDTGSWLTGRKVLITPISIGKPGWPNKTLPVAITMEQVKNSPDIDTEKPVSRQHEGEFLGYYGYPDYWDGAGLWGAGVYPGMMVPGLSNDELLRLPTRGRVDDRTRQFKPSPEHKADDVHLRSCREVSGYHIHASDGDIGHVSGMLVDEQTWAIRYLIIDTSNWWLGHQVLIAPLWIDQIQWPEEQVSVNLTRQQIQDAMTYDATVRLERTQETEMHEHYGRVGYWEHEPDELER